MPDEEVNILAEKLLLIFAAGRGYNLMECGVVDSFDLAEQFVKEKYQRKQNRKGENNGS